MEAVERVHPVGWDFELEAPSRHRDLYEQRGYEPYSATLFRASCARSDVVLDIGAHMGFYSLIARQANAAARVIAVEASPGNVEVLRRNVEEPAGVEVVSAAFSAEVGTTSFHLTEASDNGGITGHPVSPTVGTVEVPTITADSLAIGPGQRLTIKIDVEGHEISALRGVQSLLDSAATVTLFLEFNPKCLRAAGSEPDDLLLWIRERGFRLFALDEEARGWRELAHGTRWQSLVDDAGFANLYCAPAATTLTVSTVMHSGGLGGAERSQAEIGAELVARGHLVHSIVPNPDHGSVALLQSAGIAVSRVKPFPWWVRPHDEWREGLVNHEIVAILEAQRPDVVVSATSVFAQGAVAACQVGIPHVWYLREFADLDYDFELPTDRLRFGSLVSGLSDVVLTNSAAVRSHFFGDGASDRATVVPSIPAAVGIVRSPEAGRPWSVGIVGGFNPGKGHEDAFEAVALLRAEGLDVRLVLVGSGTDGDTDRLVGLARELGIRDLITMAGAFDDPGAIYSLIDAVAVTSRSEAFGRVPFEATSAGLPVVYAAAGGVVEYMTPGRTGLGYAPGNAPDLAAALRTLHDDRARAADLVAAARDDLLDPARVDARNELYLEALRTAQSGRGWSTSRSLAQWLATSAVAAEGSEELLESQLADLGARYGALEEGNRGLAAAHDALRAEHGSLVTGNRGLAAAHDALNAEHAALVHDNVALAKAHDALRAAQVELLVAEGRDKIEIERLRGVEENLHRLLGSRTWRYTEPVRRVLGRLRRG